jgi:zinc/manganese transport system substrate-binding protein
VLRLLEVPSTVDRAMGDIHPLGNPHVHLDPRNVTTVAQALTERLATIDAPHAAYYRSRGADFQARWKQAMARWSEQAARLRGVPVVVLHRDQVYLLYWLGMREVAAIEPKPGVPPSAGHLAGLVSKLTASPPRMILLNAYNNPQAADWLSERIHVPVVTLPFSVGGTPQAANLFGLFDDTLQKLLVAAGP